jgi:serine/threonine protein kinase
MTELKLLQCRLDGRYDIEDCLGRGSYAEIYMARDRGAADEQFRKVVIKALNVLLQGYQDADLERTLIQNFQNEAIALDRVRHPNIISRLGHGTAIDLTGTAFHYIVLEYLGGGDLALLCRKEALKLDRALFYLQQICAGLAHAHQGGVIHRDIKPQNLLLTADHETVKIADFGVAKLEAAEGAITRVGTNIYAAPEHNPLVQTSQLDIGLPSGAHSQLTPAADIYSLAKTAYTMICGVPPRAFAHRAITELPPPLAAQPWARSLLQVLERSTQNRPSERYQSVQDFWDDLSDAAMPATQPLVAAAVQRRISSDLKLDAEVITALAPPRPRFESSKELQQQEISSNGAARPRIVVPIAGHSTIPPAYEQAALQRGRVHVTVARNGMSGPVAGTAVTTPKPRRALRDFVVGAILVLCFAGLLLATGAYVRKLINRRTAQQQQQPPTTPSLVGREALTITDLNLRDGPNPTSDQIGLAEAGSRVRILNVNSSNNWCEVLVIQHGRAKEEPTSKDQGWVNKRYLKFD